MGLRALAHCLAASGRCTCGAGTLTNGSSFRGITRHGLVDGDTHDACLAPVLGRAFREALENTRGNRRPTAPTIGSDGQCLDRTRASYPSIPLSLQNPRCFPPTRPYLACDGTDAARILVNQPGHLARPVFLRRHLLHQLRCLRRRPSALVRRLPAKMRQSLWSSRRLGISAFGAGRGNPKSRRVPCSAHSFVEIVESFQGLESTRSEVIPESVMTRPSTATHFP